MQFRERRRVIQLIRTVYDPAIKRGRAELVGRLDKDAAEITSDIRAACSTDELAEIAAYLADRKEAVSRQAMRQAAETLARQMRMAEHYFRSHNGKAAGTVATEIYTAWDDLKKSLHKAGFRKDKRKSQEAPTTSPRRTP